MYKGLFSLMIILGFSVSSNAYAEDYAITIKDNQFLPSELTLPKNQKVKVTVKNLDATPAEFESHDLQREKVISGNGKAVIFIGPLSEGSYKFFDDFHSDTAKGVIVVK